MEIPMTQQVADYIKQTDKLSTEEKQNLFWIMLEKFGQENIFSYKIENDNYGIHYILKTKDKKSDKKRKLGIWKDKIGFIAPDFNEPLDDLADYM